MVEEIPDGTLDVLVVRKLVRNLPAFVDGRVSVPDGPGLEIELDEEIIREFRVD